MYFVYILQSLKDQRTYVGYTKDIRQRLERHNSGRVRATKYRRPLRLLFTESFLTSAEAKNREIWWKSGVGRKKLKELFEKNSWNGNFS